MGVTELDNKHKGRIIARHERRRNNQEHAAVR